MNISSLRLLACAALALAGCTKDAPNDALAKPAAASRSAPKPAAAQQERPATGETTLAGMPGPLTPELGFEHGGKPNARPAPSAPLKNVGKVGELLESDVFTFKLVSIAPCGPAPDPKTAAPNARRVVAADVEITAKEGMSVSPRDVAIGVGGIVFNGSLDSKRKVEGCGALLAPGVLLPEKSAKGRVLFDIPVTGPGSDLGQMGLIYQPTRFGGAGAVMVRSFRG
jgi:hypothetical protein